jgi:hypothetical protein
MCQTTSVSSKPDLGWVSAKQMNLNSTFSLSQFINTDGQIRRSRIARSTVSSKTFERKALVSF